ncbi:MAG TPA: phosphoribosyltransferase [Steroidobacteraceae bacterium]|nr:phosphoribosyltransferase [Steroidobacteraceae bacterium]
MKIFTNREHAGRELARRLHREVNCKDAIVLALPRGGVPVGYAVAQALRLPLDILVVRKLGVPSQPELAMGAIASGDVVVLNDDIMHMINGSQALVEEVSRIERDELLRRERTYRGDLPPLQVAGRTVILVDDGAATGATMRAAVRALQQQHATQVIAALPTASVEAFHLLKQEADQVVCLQIPELFYSVGEWYQEFAQTTDQQVMDLLARARSMNITQSA